MNKTNKQSKTKTPRVLKESKFSPLSIEIIKKLKKSGFQAYLVGGCVRDLLAGIKDEIPLGRFGYPDEVALAVLYLCSTAGSWITGSNISMNGGHNML